MAIPISYNIRNLKLRKGLTIMTALGIALTVTTAVFVMAPRKDGTGEVNVSVRGLMPAGLTLRPSAKLVEGRWFTPGQREVVVGRSIHNRFSGANVGDNLDFAKGQWKVVGVFDSGGTAYDSELWGDVNQIAADFDRQGGYSSAYLRATDAIT